MKLLDLGWLSQPVVFEGSLPERGVIGLDAPVAPAWRGKPRVALLIHGVACTWQFMRRLSADLGRLAGPREEPYYGHIALLAHDWRRGISENAERLTQLLGALAGKAEAIDLYGYSQGGLIARTTVETAGDDARDLGVRHVFTFNTPHAGSPLASLPASWLARLGAAVLGKLAVWHGDGVRDLVPGSSFLKSLSRPPRGVAYTFLAGNRGWDFFRGLTQPLFGASANDGVASVESQLDASAPGWSKGDEAWITRLTYPWEHFSIASGLAAVTAGAKPHPAQSALEAIASRIAFAA